MKEAGFDDTGVSDELKADYRSMFEKMLKSANYKVKEAKETEDEENARVKRSSQQSAPKKTFSKVVPINPTSSSRIKIMRPSDINDSTNVANEIKEGRLVIFDVGQIDNEEARRIVDYMSGAAYGVNGKVRRVSEGIFVAAPKNIDITGDTMKEHVKNGMDWNFM